MLAFKVLASLLALASPLMVLADVNPLTPGPGASFKAGQQCVVTWAGDTSSTTVWQGMAIELMSGSNLDMVHVTTVATNQDGTKSGSFQYTCPEVSPYSAIYFYQFSSNHTTTKTWTTRFTIEDPTGASTPPANADQPTGDAIPWGVGQLVDASAATPPPFGAVDSNSTSSGTSSSLSPASPSSLSSNKGLVATTSSSLVSSSSAASSPSSTATTSGALSNVVNDRRVWLSAVGVIAAVFL